MSFLTIALTGFALLAMGIGIWTSCLGLARHFDRMAIMDAMERPHDD